MGIKADKARKEARDWYKRVAMGGVFHLPHNDDRTRTKCGLGSIYEEPKIARTYNDSNCKRCRKLYNVENFRE